MIRLLKERDNKEKAIDASYEQERVNKSSYIKITSYKEKLLKEYQKWKAEKNVEGVKY